jgi:hypothetical protein
MKEEDCKLETLVAFNGKKYPLKRGKIVGSVTKSKVLVEWADGQRHLIAVNSLLSKGEADVKEVSLKEKFDKQQKKKAERDRKKAEAAKLVSQLEDEFTKVFNEVNPEIQAKIAAANKLIGEAETLSEKYGIPFRGTEPFGMSFIPGSFKKKWAKLLDQEYGYDFASDLTGAYGGEYDGWQSSQVC